LRTAIVEMMKLEIKKSVSLSEGHEILDNWAVFPDFVIPSPSAA
jgi:hypothetical protein